MARKPYFKQIKPGALYGRLTAVVFLGVLREHGTTAGVWECRCACGKRTTAKTAQLNNGRKLSCGCLKIELSKKSIHKIAGRCLPKGEAAKKVWFGNYRNDARKKGLQFEITLDTFSNYTQNDCYYCGRAPHFEFAPKRLNGGFKGNGIDRIDSSRGYVAGNIVTCCKTCNYMKNTLSQKEFLAHVKRIEVHWRNK